MLYYYNRDGRFQKESSKEYKTEKGAMDKLQKEGRGAVFDETGKMLISLVDEKEVPEGALDTNEDGSVPAFDENNEQAGTADAATVAGATGESIKEPDKEEKPEGEEQPEGGEQSGEEPNEEEQPKEDPDEMRQTKSFPYNVQTTCDLLRIRSGPGKDFPVVGNIREKNGHKKNHTITDEKDGWGRLENRERWIELALTKTVS